MLDAATANVLWENDTVQRFQFVGRDRLLCQQVPRHEIETWSILDLASGAIEHQERGRLVADSASADLAAVRSHRNTSWPGWLAARWPTVFRETTVSLRIVDLKSGLTQLELTGRNDARRVLVSEDGSTLVTDEARFVVDAVTNVVHIWDVHPHRALTWSIGSSLALGVGLLLAQAAWRKVRRPRPHVSLPTAGEQSSA